MCFKRYLDDAAEAIAKRELEKGIEEYSDGWDFGNWLER